MGLQKFIHKKEQEDLERLQGSNRGGLCGDGLDTRSDGSGPERKALGGQWHELD